MKVSFRLDLLLVPLERDASDTCWWDTEVFFVALSAVTAGLSDLRAVADAELDCCRFHAEHFKTACLCSVSLFR